MWWLSPRLEQLCKKSKRISSSETLKKPFLQDPRSQSTQGPVGIQVTGNPEVTCKAGYVVLVPAEWWGCGKKPCIPSSHPSKAKQPGNTELQEDVSSTSTGK